MNYGYARVSTKDQNLDRQIEVLKKEGLSEDFIYLEKRSGKDFDRPIYHQLLNHLKEGDVLFVKSIDRLGRDYQEIIEQWRLLYHTMKIDIVIVDFPLLDTRQYVQGLTGQFISDMFLQVMSYVAQMERENILERQKEGIECAKMRGVHFGRPKKSIPENFPEVYCLWKQGRISKREAARRLKANTTIFTRWVRDYDPNE